MHARDDVRELLRCQRRGELAGVVHLDGTAVLALVLAGVVPAEATLTQRGADVADEEALDRDGGSVGRECVDRLVHDVEHRRVGVVDGRAALVEKRDVVEGDGLARPAQELVEHARAVADGLDVHGDCSNPFEGLPTSNLSVRWICLL